MTQLSSSPPPQGVGTPRSTGHNSTGLPAWLGPWALDRIAIVGCGGSGKSHLARSLSRVLGITPVHLDGLYYDAERRFRHGGGQHQGIGVYDQVTWDFVRYIISYRRKMAPRVRTLIADNAGDAQVVILRSRGAARRYLATVPTSSAAGAVATHEERRL